VAARHAAVGALLAGLCGCAETPAAPGACERRDSPRWTPATEEVERYALDDLRWMDADGDTLVLETDEGGASWLPVRGTSAARMIVERAVPHRLLLRVSTEAGANVRIRSGSGTGALLAAREIPPGASAPVEIPFVQDAGQRAVLLIVDSPDARVDSFSVRATAWQRVAPTGAVEGAGPLQLGVLVHTEAEPQVYTDPEAFHRRADVITDLAAMLDAHGLPLSVQADMSLARGSMGLAPGWVPALAARGASFSVHTHGEDGGVEELLRVVDAAREAWTDFGVAVSDQNGGFLLAPWKALAGRGIRSLTAWKDPRGQGALPGAAVEPWRPADGATDGTDFVAHDPDGPLVYLPGAPGTDPDPLRIPEGADRMLTQALAHVRAGPPSTWYLVLHVDQFGAMVLDRDYAGWRARGGLAAELAPLDAWLTDVVDPLVADGRVTYANVDGMRLAYERWERGCAGEE
jgi:hypothetical protein